MIRLHSGYKDKVVAPTTINRRAVISLCGNGSDAGNANHALVIPAGLAFARVIERQPELNLYAADKRHPSLAGTYLAACTSFASLTGRSPIGNPYLAGLDAATARFLQEIAWETVRNYYQPPAP